MVALIALVALVVPRGVWDPLGSILPALPCPFSQQPLAPWIPCDLFSPERKESESEVLTSAPCLQPGQPLMLLASSEDEALPLSHCSLQPGTRLGSSSLQMKETSSGELGMGES